MASIIQYSAVSPNPVTAYLLSVNTPDYSGQPNTLVNPDVSQVIAQPIRYWKVSGGLVVLMTAGEQNTVDAAIAAAATLAIRTAAKANLDNFNSLPLFMRALMQIMVSEINLVREQDVARAAAVAAASSLANLQTRWAAISNLPDRTLAQLVTAIKAKVDDGTVDS